MSVKVKICGLTSAADIEAINACKPDYVGFVFYPQSRRYIMPQAAARLCSMVLPRIKKVGVFVDENIDFVINTAKLCNLDIVQLHGKEPPSYCSCFDTEVWKAVAVNDSSFSKIIKRIKRYECVINCFVLDKQSWKCAGGTGEVFNWELAKNFGDMKKIILAGGLNMYNVEQAVKIVRPYCVDVSSGVEVSGRKDLLKIKSFIETVRNLSLGGRKYFE